MMNQDLTPLHSAPEDLDEARAVGLETHILGPPGTGKTDYLKRQVRLAVDRFGPISVLVMSHTKAATRVLAGRDLPIPPSHLGTLHSVCFHALGCPAIAEGQIASWNRTHPALRLSPRNHSLTVLDELPVEFATRTSADRLYAELSILRARMIPPDPWPLRVQRFAVPWKEWQRSLGLVDFTDLLELALARCPAAPGNPAVIVVDEGQDLSRLQLAVVRQWGRSRQTSPHRPGRRSDDSGVCRR
jgi:superfamily I DNA/RNA helicase